MKASIAEKMLDILAENASIQRIVDEATALLENPIVVIDTQFHIVYSSTNVEVKNELWKQTLIEEYVSDELIFSMENSQTIEKLQMGTEPVEQEIPDGYKAIRMSLFHRRKYCGFVGMYDYCKPMTEEDKAALKCVGKAIASTLHNDDSMVNDSDNTHENLLHDLVKCDSFEQAELVSKRNPGVSFDGWKILLCLGQKGNEKNMPCGRIKDIMAQVLYRHYSTIYENRVVILFCAEKMNPHHIEHTHQIVEKYCQKYHLSAGISCEFREQEFIHFAYKQAVCAYNHGDTKSGEKVFKFEDAMVKNLALQCTQKYPAQFFEHSAVEKLAIYDKEYNTEYLYTLEQYLYHFCNLKETASALHIHYNTMKYRVSMIENIIEQSLREDNDLKMKLFFSVWLNQYADAKG